MMRANRNCVHSVFQFCGMDFEKNFMNLVVCYSTWGLVGKAKPFNEILLNMLEIFCRKVFLINFFFFVKWQMKWVLGEHCLGLQKKSLFSTN